MAASSSSSSDVQRFEIRVSRDVSNVLEFIQEEMKDCTEKNVIDLDLRTQTLTLSILEQILDLMLQSDKKIYAVYIDKVNLTEELEGRVIEVAQKLIQGVTRFISVCQQGEEASPFVKVLQKQLDETSGQKPGLMRSIILERDRRGGNLESLLSEF